MFLQMILSVSLSLVPRSQGLFEKVWQSTWQQSRITVQYITVHYITVQYSTWQLIFITLHPPASVNFLLQFPLFNRSQIHSFERFKSYTDYTFWFVVDTCGPPQIQNTMMNQTKYPGESAYFRCQVFIVVLLLLFIFLPFRPLCKDTNRINFTFSPPLPPSVPTNINILNGKIVPLSVVWRGREFDMITIGHLAWHDQSPQDGRIVPHAAKWWWDGWSCWLPLQKYQKEKYKR